MCRRLGTLLASELPAMAVIGIGVDAVEIDRVERALGRTPTLAARLFTEHERAHCTSRCGRLRGGGLAARFAAKEAVLKALGGAAGFSFREIEITSDEHGRPLVRLDGAVGRRAAELGVDRVHVSLTTTGTVAVANALAEGA